MGERKRTNQTDPTRTKGRTEVLRRNAASRDRSSNQGRLLERKASHLANMPPPPEHPSQVSGASCMDPCYDALVGATTPTDNKRGNAPAKCTPDRHQSESFLGLANTPQVGTCRVKIRAARRKSAKNRQGLDRTHKCTGAQVRRAKTLTGRARHQNSLQP